MKRRFFSLGIIAVLFGALIGTSGCSKNLTYENAEKYTAGGTTLTAAVTDVEIEWLAGSVEFAYGEGEGVTFKETSATDLDKRTMLYYWLENTTLHIKFAQSRIGWWNGAYPDKDLVVTLPKDLVLTEVEVDTASADIDLNNLSARRIEADSSSGAIMGVLSDATKELNVESLSGSVDITANGLQKFEIETTSTDVKLSAGMDLSEGSFDSISGNFTLTLPETFEGFSVEFESVSGNFNSDFTTEKRGNRYVYGTGATELEVENTSGNVNVKKG
ncbi:MAG: DUF4097 domain-containing protein [Clostridiales bacterium]|nr:DUF4097 domain-containing protein [Clostridiales bacterium]